MDPQMARRSRLATLMTGAALLVVAPAAAQDDVYRSAHHDFRVVTVADGFEHPWSIAFLPGGDILVTERPGRLRIIRDGRLVPAPVEGVPPVFAVGQGGLLDVVPHPEFEQNRLVYLSYSKPLGGQESTTAVIRGRLENDRLADVEEVFEAASRGRGHYGSRIVFDGSGHMFVSVGDRMASPSGDLEGHPAQDLIDHHGTVNRLTEDGGVPQDNPFVGRQGVRPEIWSYGHRNPQSLALHPETGELWEAEHGPQGGDEINLIRPGVNYGWPVIGFGVNYGSGSTIHEGTRRDGMQMPVHVWVPSIATSGMMIYDGDAFPEWRGDVFVGGLSGEQLARVEIEDGVSMLEETLLRGFGRIRDVRQGPDGFIYLAIDAQGNDLTPIVRLEPVR
ncbi:MAG TPA: PQQ-dependent sugar dehydrogenase [Longimicrobiales bacterium]|nr:PQQ-dependent sugar dehydrogenase [Longimicrobiales bacterium]